MFRGDGQGRTRPPRRIAHRRCLDRRGCTGLCEAFISRCRVARTGTRRAESRSGRTLLVEVTDDHSAAVAGAELEVVGAVERMPIGTRTEGDGRARVGGLGEGPWSVTARAPGYEEKTLRANRDGESVAIVLRRLGDMQVKTIDAHDMPVSGAHVSVAGVAPLASAICRHRLPRTGDHPGFQPGRFALRATLGDLVSPTEIGVEVEPDHHAEIGVRMAPGRWVGVRVTEGEDVDAPSIQGARVTLAERGLTPFPLEAVTDKRGAARLGPIAVGPANTERSGRRVDGSRRDSRG